MNASAGSLSDAPTQTKTYEELFDYAAVWPWVPQSAVADPRVAQENGGLSITDALYPEEQARFNESWKEKALNRILPSQPPPPPPKDTYSTDVKEIQDAEHTDPQE
jgi:hypothetical protein